MSVCFCSLSSGGANISVNVVAAVMYWGKRAIRFVRLVLKVVTKHNGDFVNVILLYSVTHTRTHTHARTHTQGVCWEKNTRLLNVCYSVITVLTLCRCCASAGFEMFLSLKLVIAFGYVSAKELCSDWTDSYEILKFVRYTGLFISPSGISELDCATTKTDTAERSISIGRESVQVFLY